MNRLSTDKQTAIIRCLVEGNSIRSTVRITGASKNTISKLLVDVGTACREYQDKALRNLPCKRIEVDEIWSFCYAKQKNVPKKLKNEFGYGDIWTWTAICADTKIIPSWVVGLRNAEYAEAFISDLAERLENRVQLTSDGFRLYVDAVEESFGSDIDYAQLIKLYGNTSEGQKRYSPAACTGTQKNRIAGTPDKKKISTSYVERNNLTMRMGMRRFTRLTNGFSKKVENLEHAVSLHMMYYNFVRIHKTLKVTPAMEAGVSETLWTVEDIVALIR